MSQEIDAAGAPEVATPSRARRIIAFPLVLMVIAIVFVIAASALSGRFVRLIAAPDASPLRLVSAAIAITCLLTTYWLFCRFVEREPMRDFSRPGWARELAVGFAAGALLFSTVVAIVAAMGFYHVAGWGDPLTTLWAPLTASIVAGFAEELLFRGILFRFIERAAGSWIALALTSILFGAAHLGNPNATFFSAAAIAVEAGILLGAVYMLTRRLWAPIGLHAAWNFTQGWVFGLPVSGTGGGAGLVQGQLSGPELMTGGAFGLEASVPALVVATSAGIAILVAAHRKGRFVSPMWRKPAALAPQIAAD